MRTGPATVAITAEDAIELSELLDFVADWVRAAPATVACDFARFVGAGSDYSTAELHRRLVGFSSLLLAAHKAATR
jgi:hypothetical protein